VPEPDDPRRHCPVDLRQVLLEPVVLGREVLGLGLESDHVDVAVVEAVVHVAGFTTALGR